MAKANSKKKIVKTAPKKRANKAPVKKVKKTVAKKKVVKPNKLKVKPVIKKTIKKAVKKVVKKAAKKTGKPPVKKVLKKAVKKVVIKKVAAKAKKSIKKQLVKKTIKKPIKKAVVKKSAVKPAKQAKPVKPVKISPKSKTIAKSGKVVTSKEVIKPKKDRNEFDRKMEQKAQRILKELEERMDISKVKPRISVPLPAPKPKPAPVVVSLPEPTNTNKEKLQMEFEFRSSRSILFYYLSDPSGLAGWFADDVYEKEHRFTFTWEGSTQTARQVAIQENTLIRFQWDIEIDGTYFQFEIKEDEITGDIALVITDWANPGESDSNAKLWESQVLKLKQLIGS